MKLGNTAVITIAFTIIACNTFAADLTLTGTGIGSQALGQQEPWYGSFSFIWLDGANHPPRVSQQYIPNPWPYQHAGVGTSAAGWTSLDNANPGRYALDLEGYQLQNEIIFTNGADPNYGHEHRWYSGSPSPVWRIIDTSNGSQLASGTSDVLFLDVNYAPPVANGYWVKGSAAVTVTNDGGAFYNELVSQTGTPNLTLDFESTTFPVVYIEGRPLADGWGTYASTWKLSTLSHLNMSVVSDTPGKGGGTVTSTPGSISCTGSGSSQAGMSGNCQADFVPGTTLTLMQAPDSNSNYGAWSIQQCGTAQNCQTIINSALQIGITFPYASKARVVSSGQGSESLSAAYEAATNTDSISARAVTFDENFVLGSNKSIFLNGGFDTAYNLANDLTLLRGSLTISSGSLTVSRVAIIP